MGVLKVFMKKKEISTTKAPKPGGKYSQAIEVGNIVFLSGQLPIDHKTSQVITNDFELVFRLCFKNLAAICEAANGSLDNIVKLNVFLTEKEASPYLDKVLPEFFNKPYPARSRIFINNLSQNAQVEIEAIMVK